MVDDSTSVRDGKRKKWNENNSVYGLRKNNTL